MSKKMLVNATQHEENRVAIVEDGILTELDIEVAGHEPTKGNIYKAVVVRVESGLQAAFVDYGAGRLGFLQIDEINYKAVKPDYQPAEDGRRPRITDLLQRGQELLVQITKEERGTKGAALTTYLSLAGRYMVIMPGSQTRGVSRKAESDSQRKELKKAMSSLDLADGVGYIVRTAALDQTREELERDYRYLIRLFESIKALEEKAKAPTLIYKESNLMIRSIRDYFTTDMDEVLIDDPQVFKEAKDFFQMVMPDHVKLVKLHQERRPIFSRYQIEDQIETLNRNQVPLPSGGSIVIDPTEALVAIDVNSGKMASEQGVEATATKTNLEAAEEVGRQLRLRDLGGLIVIDFIDMRERKNMRQVENQVKKSLKNDKARVNVGRISQFGLLEMSRQRIKAALTEGSYLPCPHCLGSGRLKSPETQAASLLRKIHASAAKGQISRIEAQLPLEVAAYLLNNKREELVEMERDHRLQVHIHGNRDFLADQVEIEITKKEKERSTQQEFVSAGSLPLTDDTNKKESGESAAQETSENNGETEKKRRRRRRRKPASAEGSSQAAEQTDGIKADDSGTEETAPVEQQETTEETSAEDAAARKPQRRRRSSNRSKTVPESDSPADVAPDESKEANTEKTDPAVSAEDDAKPRPRRRGRRKPKASEDATSAEAVQTPAESTAASEQQATAQESAENTDEVKRKPRRGSRRKPKVAEETTSTDTAPESQEIKSAQPDTTAEAPAEKTSGAEESPAENKPKSRRGRRPTKKPAQEPSEAPKGEEAKQAAVDSTETKPGEAEKPAAKKPARRTRKTTARPQKTAQETTAGEEKDGTAEKEQVEKKEKQQPKQRRTSRAKPKPKDTEVAAEVKVESQTEDKAEDKPAKKTAPKRAPRKTAPKKPATKSKETAEKNTDKSAKEPAVEEQKPKRRRTVNKKPAVKETLPTEQ